jgi:hypothetical protein
MGTLRIRAMCCRQLAPMRLVPFSYFLHLLEGWTQPVVAEGTALVDGACFSAIADRAATGSLHLPLDELEGPI